jgi:multidrug transporter EmrE-like cation transporter
MMNKMAYGCVLLTILLTVVGQVIVKWQVSKAGVFPAEPIEQLYFFARLLLNPWILSGFAAAFLASVAWMGAMTKLDLSHAYPFVSANFILVFVLSAVLFNEPVTGPKVAGLALIVAGIIVGSHG